MPAFEPEWTAVLEESRRRYSLAGLYEVAHAPAADAFAASGYDDSGSVDMAELRGRRR
ncbi:hypothetical protein [Streptomyces lavendulae]|uniref:hypothetical protein n=1 Tax=Streptomyces lavendulae TaxID=1914 RepID=UPI0036A11968